MGKVAKYFLYAGLLVVALIVWALSGEIGRFVARSLINSSQNGYKQGVIEEAQELAAKNVRAQLPIRIDENTVLQNVLSSGKTLLYHYRLLTTKQDIDYNSFHKRMTNSLINNVCHEKNMRFILDNGGAYEYVYLGSDGNLIDQITITSSSCL